MAVIRPRDLLTDGLLGRLGGGTSTDSGVNSHRRDSVGRDIAKLADAGYLKVALPPEFGGLGCTLRQAACGQRRLARSAPRTAAAVAAHLYWTGAAVDAYRSGDDSIRWILLEAARGALFGAGHGEPGNDLVLSSPKSRCEAAGQMGYRFQTPGVLSSVTPRWDWAAVHGVTSGGRPDAVLAFAGRGSRCAPAFRVARVLPAGAPSDVFTTSAAAWGNSLIASAQYSIARRAFNEALIAYDRRPLDPDEAHPLDQWPIAEASLRLDSMKSTIAAVTHPWPRVPEEGPDLGGQRLIGIYTMRHQVADGAAHVYRLLSQLSAEGAATVPAL
ncbi:MAG TPA: hypothetical protein VGG75_03115 [Trebonia sp.]